MNWNKIDSDVEIPWHKVLVYDGGNTSFGYLISIFTTQHERQLNWTITPDYEGKNKFKPTHWSIIEKPKENE